MLHEVLLALSGHPSPLFPSSLERDAESDGSRHVNKTFPLLSPSEVALLESVGKLALLHRQIRAHAQRITLEHHSVICRAVASSLLHTHLARFQKKVLDVESQIVTKDASLVGAYNIVPLSAVVGEFDEWSRRMEWYWRLACYMQGPGRASAATRATGAVLIDHLRAESQTGFPDIEAVSVELSQVAEKAWLKQLSVWLLYGQIPTHGASDFFVDLRESADVDALDTYTARHTLLPNFISRPTGASLLFIGKSLHQVKRHRQGYSSQPSATESAADSQLLSEHLQLLSSLTLPLAPTTFSTTISRIRSSLSQKVLQKLLPIEDIEVSLNALRQFFLLERGEFATALIWEAQEQLKSRQGDMGRFLPDDPSKKLQGVLIKEGEVAETLARTFKVLNSSQSEDAEDEVVEFAREHLCLEMTQTDHSRPSSSSSDDMMADMPQPTNVSFNDVLFPVPTWLSMDTRSPLDLFISRSDVRRYASINAYLVALRRAHMRLSDLWRLSGTRREDPKASHTGRLRRRSRVAAMRKVWATCSAAVFLLSETTAYFEGEVIKGSWDHFFQWVVRGSCFSLPCSSPSSSEAAAAAAAAATAHDPETLSSAHRLFLSSLTYALVLTDASYTLALRGLLSNVDALVGHFTHLHHVQRALDLDADSGIAASYATVRDERAVALELDRARKRVDSGMKDVVDRLRRLDDERLGDVMYRGVRVVDGGGGGGGRGGDDGEGFEAWRGGGVERLLMKLDFGRVTEDEMMFN